MPVGVENPCVQVMPPVSTREQGRRVSQSVWIALGPDRWCVVASSRGRAATVVTAPVRYGTCRTDGSWRPWWPTDLAGDPENGEV